MRDCDESVAGEFECGCGWIGDFCDMPVRDDGRECPMCEQLAEPELEKWEWDERMGAW